LLQTNLTSSGPFVVSKDPSCPNVILTFDGPVKNVVIGPKQFTLPGGAIIEVYAASAPVPQGPFAASGLSDTWSACLHYSLKSGSVPEQVTLDGEQLDVFWEAACEGLETASACLPADAMASLVEPVKGPITLSIHVDAGSAEPPDTTPPQVDPDGSTADGVPYSLKPVDPDAPQTEDGGPYSGPPVGFGPGQTSVEMKLSFDEPVGLTTEMTLVDGEGDVKVTAVQDPEHPGTWILTYTKESDAWGARGGRGRICIFA